LVWRAASLVPGIAAAAPYYGGGMTTPEETARQPKVPVLAHFGNQDHWIPLDTIEAFKKAHPEVEVHVYESGHGFNCDQRGSYNAEAAKLARTRTLEFFARHVG
ncbi:MAG TPA: dienelactone hydrolase family protein, partial [Variovorax sp.]|nr:dienelactone hydrolase family protein [Variovorax sp.]